MRHVWLTLPSMSMSTNRPPATKPGLRHRRINRKTPFRFPPVLTETALFSLRSFGGEVLVFHFPGVIQRVIRGVPNQVPERPGSGHFTLGMERPNGCGIGVAMRFQFLVGQHRVVRREYPELLRPVLLSADHMTDDSVPITPSPARALLQLSRHARTHLVEERPARPH